MKSIAWERANSTASSRLTSLFSLSICKGVSYVREETEGRVVMRSLWYRDGRVMRERWGRRGATREGDGRGMALVVKATLVELVVDHLGGKEGQERERRSGRGTLD